jgi:hypothetical protein
VKPPVRAPSQVAGLAPRHSRQGKPPGEEVRKHQVWRDQKLAQSVNEDVEEGEDTDRRNMDRQDNSLQAEERDREEDMHKECSREEEGGERQVHCKRWMPQLRLCRIRMHM